MSKFEKNYDGPVLLFDGVCNFCSSSVQFILKRDKEAKFRFAHLQSDYGKEQLKKYNINEGDPLQSMVLIQDGTIYTKSSAAIQIAKQLNCPWPIFYGTIIVPRFIRDPIYDFIGNHRYQWFGKKDQCWIPENNEYRERFID